MRGTVNHSIRQTLNCPPYSRLRIGEVYQVTLESRRPLKNFVYNIIGRGNVLQTERVVLSEPQEVHSITLTPTFQMLPNGRIYAYYVDDSGAFRHAKTEFDVEVQLPNPIQISAPAEVRPGADVELEIKTAPGSFVGLMAVDQSACLGANNDIKNDPFSCLERYNIYPTWQRLIRLVTMTNAEFFYDRMPIYCLRGNSIMIERCFTLIALELSQLKMNFPLCAIYRKL